MQALYLNILFWDLTKQEADSLSQELNKNYIIDCAHCLESELSTDVECVLASISIVRLHFLVFM